EMETRPGGLGRGGSGSGCSGTLLLLTHGTYAQQEVAPRGGLGCCDERSHCIGVLGKQVVDRGNVPVESFGPIGNKDDGNPSGVFDDPLIMIRPGVDRPVRRELLQYGT